MSDASPVPGEEPATVELTAERTGATRVFVDFAARTDVGKVRPHNEDQFLVAKLAKAMRVCATSLVGDDAIRLGDDRGALLVVADGMGGHAAGERASALAVNTIEGFVLNSLKWFFRLGVGEETFLLQELREALKEADRTLVDWAEVEPELAGMGTTLTLAFSVDDRLFIAHAGDSRAYLYRNGELDQLTRDHTMVQSLVDAGLMTPGQARQDRRRHLVTNALGGPSPGVHAELDKMTLQDGDTILLCTDGLTGPVEDARIAEVLAGQPEPEDACDALVDLALARGGPDNVTVVVARYSIASANVARQSERIAHRALLTGLFVKLAEAIDVGDGRRAAAAQQQLRKLGWAVSPPSRP
ncbi:MAG TPA: PP2C family serine/threonine-protein phosphatase [Gemmataceae bacterium]|jgi:protein phosphatase|nr:PP2C family serine/threonine-protein phosphatase [Gemmataceae bacterium]